MGSRRQAREMALQILCTMERQPELSADQAATLFFKYQAYSNQDDEGEASATPQAAVPTQRRSYLQRAAGAWGQ